MVENDLIMADFLDEYDFPSGNLLQFAIENGYLYLL